MVREKRWIGQASDEKGCGGIKCSLVLFNLHSFSALLTLKYHAVRVESVCNAFYGEKKKGIEKAWDSQNQRNNRREWMKRREEEEA